MNLTTVDSFDCLFDPELEPKPLPPGFVWKVIYDPTRNADDPGLFFGAYFRFFDLVHSSNEECTWPEGIIFEHKDTGVILRIRNGQIEYPEKKSTLNEIKERREKGGDKRGVIYITIIGNDYDITGENL